MAKGNIALSNTINITIADTPSGLGEFNTNTICLFSNEQPLSVEPYIWAVSAQDVINEYGADSLTAKMAIGIFSPSQNLRTGRGQLLVFPFDGVNATSGTLTTQAITAEVIQAFQAVANGDLTIEIDGQDYIATKLNFSAISQVDDIVTILENIGLDVDIEVVNTNQIKFTSRNTGTNSAVVIKETSEGAGTDLYGETLLNGATAVAEAGTNASGTKLSEAIAQAEEVGYFGGILTTQICDNDTIVENATYINGTDHIYYEATNSLKNIGTLGAEIQNATLTKTRLMAYTSKGSTGAKQAIATYATVAQSVNYSGTNTVLTMNLKELTGITPDTNLTQTYYNLAKQYGVDIYGSTEGLSCVYSFDNGDYTDETTTDLWFKKALEVRGFNYLRQTNSKIPQTESGMVGLKSAYEQACIQGVRNGSFAGGEWNNAVPFGDPEDFKRNIRENGYYIYSLPISKQAQAEREERIAPLVQIACKRSGAFHSSDVIVNIQR